jgi:hypothetical protein
MYPLCGLTQGKIHLHCSSVWQRAAKQPLPMNLHAPSSLNEWLTLFEVWDVELVWPVAGTCQRHQKEQLFNGSRYPWEQCRSRYPWEQCQSTPPHPSATGLERGFHRNRVRSRTGEVENPHLGMKPSFCETSETILNLNYDKCHGS